MKKLFIIFIFLFYFKGLNSQTKWNGLTVRVQSGLYYDFVKMKLKDGTMSIPTGIDAIFGWGIEYSLLIKKNFFISLDLGFPYYNAVFRGDEMSANPMFGDYILSATRFYIIPIIYPHFGYATKDWLFTLGTAYYWGITSTIKRSITKNISAEFRYSWFFDKFTYNDGLHDMHFLFSLRYTF